jgi:hypothetical protein
MHPENRKLVLRLYRKFVSDRREDSVKKDPVGYHIYMSSALLFELDDIEKYPLGSRMRGELERRERYHRARFESRALSSALSEHE